MTIVVLCLGVHLTAQFGRSSRAPEIESVLNIAEGATKPLFTPFLTNMVCWDGPFVALASVKPQQLVVIRITENGIQPPASVSVPYNDIYGMKCYWDRIELLVRSDESDRFSRLPFKITASEIQQQEPQEIQYSISKKGPTPPDIADFYKSAQQLKLTLGDWRVQLNTFDSKHLYELHFSRTEHFSNSGLAKTLSLTLLQETFRRKILMSLPLVYEETAEYAD